MSVGATAEWRLTPGDAVVIGQFQGRSLMPTGLARAEMKQLAITGAGTSHDAGTARVTLYRS